MSNDIQKKYDRLSPLALPIEIIQMRLISKETLEEVNRLGGVLVDGSLMALHTMLSEDPSKLKVFICILLKSEQMAPFAKDIIKDSGKYQHIYLLVIIFYL